jgi:hypothetical protein
MPSAFIAAVREQRGALLDIAHESTAYERLGEVVKAANLKPGD